MPLYIRLALILLSSILATLAFPPFSYWPLALIAWIPLFIAIRHLKARPAFYIGLIQGFLLYAMTLSWLWHIFSATAVILWLIIAIFTGISCALISTLRSSVYLKASLAASVWVGAEFFRSEIYMLHFPWMTPGVAMQPSWLSPLIGVYGVSFLIIFSAILLTSAPKRNDRASYLAASIIVLLCVSGFYKSSPQQGDIPIIAIQNETGSHIDNLALTEQALADAKAATDQQGIILWPELAVNDRALDVPYISQDLYAFSSAQDHVFIFGAYSNADKPSKREGLNYNSAITLHRSKLLGVHHKNRPVPLFNDGVQHDVAKSIKTPIGTIGTPICFDCDHEAIIRRMVADGAQALIVPSLDAEHWSERQHHQHAELFRHRAAENKRWIAVAASSGVTQIIDPTGNRIQSIPAMTTGYLIGKVSLTDGRTFYNRYGWMIGYLCMAVTALLSLQRIVSHLISKLRK